MLTEKQFLELGVGGYTSLLNIYPLDIGNNQKDYIFEFAYDRAYRVFSSFKNKNHIANIRVTEYLGLQEFATIKNNKLYKSSFVLDTHTYNYSCNNSNNYNYYTYKVMDLTDSLYHFSILDSIPNITLEAINTYPTVSNHINEIIEDYWSPMIKNDTIHTIPEFKPLRKDLKARFPIRAFDSQLVFSIKKYEENLFCDVYYRKRILTEEDLKALEIDFPYSNPLEYPNTGYTKA